MHVDNAYYSVNKPYTFSIDQVSGHSYTWTCQGAIPWSSQTNTFNLIFPQVGNYTISCDDNDGSTVTTKSFTIGVGGGVIIPGYISQSNWYFGKYCSLKFSGGNLPVSTPDAFCNASVYTDEAAISHSDVNGDPVFFSNGLSLWSVQATNPSNCIGSNSSGVLPINSETHTINTNSIGIPGLEIEQVNATQIYENSSNQQVYYYSSHGLTYCPYPGHPGEFFILAPPVNENVDDFLTNSTTNLTQNYLSASIKHYNSQTDVVSNSTFIFDANNPLNRIHEGTTMIPHCNGTDYWIIAAGDGRSNDVSQNVAGEGKMYVVRVSQNGLTNADGTIQQAEIFDFSSIFDLDNLTYDIYDINASPNSNQILVTWRKVDGGNGGAFTSTEFKVFLVDFDNSTGVLSDATVRELSDLTTLGIDPTNSLPLFGSNSFSPDGLIAYFTGNFQLIGEPSNGPKIVAYRLSDDANYVVPYSSPTPNISYLFNDLKLAPDGNLFIATGFYSLSFNGPLIDVLANPNTFIMPPNPLTPAINYSSIPFLVNNAGLQYQKPTAFPTNSDALPIAPIQPQLTASFPSYPDCQDVTFDIGSCWATYTIVWDFGDGSSTQTQVGNSIIHAYAGSGPYTATALVYFGTPGGGNALLWTLNTTVNIVAPTITYSVNPGSQLPGTNQVITLTPSAGLTYVWTPSNSIVSNNSNFSVVTVNPVVSTSYTVTALNSCPSPITINITVIPSTFCSFTPTLPVISLANNNTDVSSFSMSTFTSEDIVVDDYQTLYIDQNTTFNLCNFRMGEKAKIVVQSGFILTLEECNIAGCNASWDRINVEPDAQVVANECRIEDAAVAIQTHETGFGTISFCDFNKNVVGFEALNFPGGTSQTSIDGSKFIFDPANTINGSSVMFNGYSALTGVVVKDHRDFTIGSPITIGNNINQNIFENIRNGIESSNSHLQVYNNYFHDLIEVSPSSATYFGYGIVVSGSTFFIGEADDGANLFKGCPNGILIHNNCPSGTIYNNLFAYSGFDNGLVPTNYCINFVENYNVEEFNVLNNIFNDPQTYPVNNNLLGLFYSETTINFEGNSGYSVNLLENRLAHTSTAVNIFNNSLSFRIGYNRFNQDVVEDINNVGQYGEKGVYAINTGLTSGLEQISIYSNHFQDFEQQVFVKDYHNSMVSYNWLEHYWLADFVGAKSGITIVDCPNNEVTKNTVSTRTTYMPDLDDIDPATPFTGISLQGNSTPSTVSENQCDRFGKGFYFKDIPNNNPPAQVINFSCNQMKENMFGVEFDNSNIGDQGSPNPGGVSHGNYWIYTDNGVLDVYGNNFCKHLVATNYSINNIPAWYHIDPVGGMGQVDFPDGPNSLPDYINAAIWIGNVLDATLSNFCEYRFVREGNEEKPLPPINNENKTDLFSLYPNPNAGDFVVNLPQNWLGCEYQLIDAKGQVVAIGRLRNTNNELSFSSKNLSEGIYHFRLTLEGVILEKVNIVISH